MAGIIWAAPWWKGESEELEEPELREAVREPWPTELELGVCCPFWPSRKGGYDTGGLCKVDSKEVTSATSCVARLRWGQSGEPKALAAQGIFVKWNNRTLGRPRDGFALMASKQVLWFTCTAKDECQMSVTFDPAYDME